MGSGKLFIFFALAFIFFVQRATAQHDVPSLQGKRIHDNAQILNEVIIDNLEHELRLYQDTSSNQIAVLIIPSLEGDTLDDYSLRVATTWKLGQKSKDNGVLLLIVMEGHQLRIEVGQGLEGVLTDALCSRIIRSEIVPELRKENYDVAVTNGIHAIIKAIGNEYVLSEGDITDDSNMLSFTGQILFGIFLVIILGTITFIALFAENPRGWGLYVFMIPFYGTFPMIVLGWKGGLKLLASYVIIMPLAKIIIANTEWGKAKMKRMKGRYQSSDGRSSSTRDSSQGSSGSSSFSGGGGSFGGGGSSGRW